MDYMARAITEGTATGAHFVDTMVDETERYVRAGIADGSIRAVSDPRATAVYIAAGSLGMLLIPDHLARSLGLEARSPDVLRRLSGPALELYTTGLYTDDAVLRVAEESIAALSAPAAPASPAEPAGEDTGPPGTADREAAGAGSAGAAPIKGRTDPGAPVTQPGERPGDRPGDRP